MSQTGTLGFELLIILAIVLAVAAALVALPVSVLLTLAISRLFRRQVGKSMWAASGLGMPSAQAEKLPSKPPGTLEIDFADSTREMARAAYKRNELMEVRRRTCRLAATYAMSASAMAAIFAVAMFFASNRGNYTWPGSALWFFLLFLTTATPALIAAAIVLTHRLRFIVLTILFVATLCACLLLSIGLENRIPGHFMWLWAPFVGVPAVFFVTLHVRRLRAIGPVLLTATLLVLLGLGAGTFGSVLYLWNEAGPVHFVREDLAKLPLLEAATKLFEELHGESLTDQNARVRAFFENPQETIRPENRTALDNPVVLFWFFSIWFTASALGVVAAFAFLRWIARSYHSGRASDQMLSIDVLMIIFALWSFVAFAAAYGWLVAVFAPVGYFAFKAMTRWRLKTRSRLTSHTAPRTLLLLRVFGFDKRTQGLLDRLGWTWRYLGPIRLIGGPDLAYATIEPHEFFEFLDQRLSRAFIKGQEDVDRLLRESRGEPDLDGLYRVEDFFCHDDTWQMTVARLSKETDAVLMDLRGFAPANRGCVQEIEELIASVPLRRIALLIDNTTDIALLDQTVRRAWDVMPTGSPNSSPGVHRLRVLRASSHTQRTLSTLLGMLCEEFQSRAHVERRVPIETPAPRMS